MKPLDFVKTVPKGNVGMITEVSTSQGVLTASVAFVEDNTREKTAWWSSDELIIIGSLPALLSKELCHPFASKRNRLFPF
jgi:hypothetical protein